MDKPSIIEITIIALIGGLLGVLFMIPLRNALIVKEHGVLPYPEGTACAEVLLAGEEGGANASTVFAGLGIAAGFKFIIDGLKLVPSEVSFRVKGYAGEIGTQYLPSCYERWLHLWTKNFFLYVCRWYCQLAGIYSGNCTVW